MILILVLFWCCLWSALLSLCHPIDYGRALARSISPRLNQENLIPPTDAENSTIKDTAAPDNLSILFNGNEKFRQQKLSLGYNTSNPFRSPEFMFIGCSDNSLSTEAVFQTLPGTSVSHVNLANQFNGKDPSSSVALANAIQNSGVKYIIVMGHYGCTAVHMAMTRKSIDRIFRAWLQPINNLFFHSKRAEIKKLRNLRRWHDDDGAKKADNAAFRALVEENVKATVKNLQNESLFSIVYRRKKQEKLKYQVFVYGFVLDEDSGEVKDLGIAFGPPGETIPKPPFEVIVPPKQRNLFGKFNPKAKKLAPTPTSSPTTTSTPMNS